MKKNAFLIGLVTLLIACSGKNDSTLNKRYEYNLRERNKPVASPVDRQLRKIIERYGLTGEPKPTGTTDIQSAKAQLGKKLFFSRALSGDLNVACASCHHPLLGGSDNLSLSVGVNSRHAETLGVGRRHKGSASPVIARNAPTTFNLAFWQNVLFHDGRIQRLANGDLTTPDVKFPEPDPSAGGDLLKAQARFPITSKNEMRGENFHKDGSPQVYREKLAERLGGYGSQANAFSAAEAQYWLDEFRQAFNAPDGLPNTLITEQNISAALADYQRSQIFTNNKWKRYIKGDAEAISDNAKRGALLFYRQQDQNGYACVNCHSGDFFTNEQFYHTLIPPVGPGKVDKNGFLLSNRDTGRGLITGNSMDRFKFRVPSLLNVEVTGPWAHNGAYTTLADITRHMLNPYNSAIKYDPRQLLQSSVQTADIRKQMGEMLACDVAIPGRSYKEKEVQELVAFLLTLTDPCVKDRQCMQPWIAGKDDVDPMGLMLIGRSENGKRL